MIESLGVSRFTFFVELQLRLCENRGIPVLFAIKCRYVDAHAQFNMVNGLSGMASFELGFFIYGKTKWLANNDGDEGSGKYLITP